MYKIKVLFIYPNEYLSIGIHSGIAILSAVLKEAGHTVDLLDFTFVKTKILEIEKTSGPSVFLPTEYTLEDLVTKDPITSLEEAYNQKINSFNPEIIAVSVMTGHFSSIVAFLEKVHIPCKVIFGGIHPTICPEETLSKDVIDFICVGEAEEMFLELLESLENGKDYTTIKNLGYKENGKLIINSLRPFIDLNKLPVPDWGLFDKRHLFRPFMGKIYTGSFYVMSRGCPGQCTYCVNSSLREKQKGCGRYFRYQSPETTIKQLKALNEKFNASWFKLADDSIMLFKVKYLKELSKGLKPLDFMFGCSIRPETVTERKIELIKEMGVVAASLGIESGNERIRKEVLWRPMTNEQIINAIKLLQKYNIRVSTFNMIGLPEETRENVFETIKLNKMLNIETSSVYILYPYPGTHINDKFNVNIYDENREIIPVSRASKFNLSTMEPSEVEGLIMTFELYVRLPEKLWPIIKIAEKSDETACELREALQYLVLEYM